MTVNVEDILEKHTNQIETLFVQYHLLDKQLALYHQDHEYMKLTLEEIKDQLIDVNNKLAKMPKEVSKASLTEILKSNWKTVAVVGCFIIFVMHSVGEYLFSTIKPFLNHLMGK